MLIYLPPLICRELRPSGMPLCTATATVFTFISPHANAHALAKSTAGVLDAVRGRTADSELTERASVWQRVSSGVAAVSAARSLLIKADQAKCNCVRMGQREVLREAVEKSTLTSVYTTAEVFDLHILHCTDTATKLRPH